LVLKTLSFAPSPAWLPSRRPPGDAEHIVGALLSAGYRADGRESSLNEVIAANRSPGATLVKTTELAQPVVDDVSRIAQLAIPVRASMVTIFPGIADLSRGNIQIDCFNGRMVNERTVFGLIASDQRELRRVCR
jgi:hypothetical protein